MAGEDIKRRLAALMSADVKEYSRLMQQDEAGTVRTLTAYREVMGTLVQQHHGRVVDSPGDNLLAEFASVVDAVQGAVAIQRELKARNAEQPNDRKMEFRIGINLGDIIIEGDRIYGDGVNIAARLEELADPGGICISRTAYDQIEDKLPFGYEYLGERRVKNIAKPVRAYKVLLEPEESHRATREEAAERWQRRGHFGPIVVERPVGRKHRAEFSFPRHLRTYVIVIGFLLIIDLLSGDGLWFYWPALGWGLFLVLRWHRSSLRGDDGSVAGDSGTPVTERETHPEGEKPRYLIIRVEPKGSESSRKGRVNVRIPIRLLRAGVKLSTVLPDHAKDRIQEVLKEKGIDFDVFALDGQRLDELLRSLTESGIEVDQDDKKVLIFCE